MLSEQSIMLALVTFWFGMGLMAMALLSTKFVTFRLQIVEPPKPKLRRRIKRLTGIQADDLWDTVAAWHASGWNFVLKEEHGVRIYTVILERYSTNGNGF